MATPQLRISELVQERTALLLSKASGVSEEAIERLQTSNLEDFNQKTLTQLLEIAGSLEVSVFDLFEPISDEEAPIEELTLKSWAERRSISSEHMDFLIESFATEITIVDLVCSTKPKPQGCP